MRFRKCLRRMRLAIGGNEDGKTHVAQTRWFVLDSARVFDSLVVGLVAHLPKSARACALAVTLAFSLTLVPASRPQIAHAESLIRIEGRHMAVELTPADSARFRDLRTWVNKLDAAYDAMADLMGYTPYGGATVTLREDPSLTQAGLLSGNPIRWNASLVVPSAASINSRNDLLFGPIHELGHDFDERGGAYVVWAPEDAGYGPLNPELWANLKALYALDALAERFPGTTININYWQPDTYEPPDQLKNRIIREHGDRYLAGPRKTWTAVSHDDFLGLLLKARQTIGWEPFRRAMHIESQFVGSPASSEDKLNVFLYLLSQYGNSDVAATFASWGFPTGGDKQANAANWVGSQTAQRLALHNGDLVRSNDPSNREIDVIQDGSRRWIPNPDTLTAITSRYGRGVEAVASTDFSSMPTRTQIPDSVGDAAGFQRAMVDIYGFWPDGGPWAVNPPYDDCGYAQAAGAPTQKDQLQLLKQGFAGRTSFDCDLSSGTLHLRVVAWGGTDGGAGIGGTTDPTAASDDSGGFGSEFTPVVSGPLAIEATVTADGVASTAAGSGLAADVPTSITDLLVEFLPDVLDAVLKLVTSVFNPTASTAQASMFLEVSGSASGYCEQSITAAGSSFPEVGPWTMDRPIGSVQETCSVTVDAQAGQPIRIRAGVRAQTKAWGAAASVVRYDQVSVNGFRLHRP